MQNASTITKVFIMTPDADGNTPNAPEFEKLLKAAEKFGEHAAAGIDSRPNLGMLAARGAELGSFKVGPVDAKGNSVTGDDTGDDAATRLYRAWKSRAVKTAHRAGNTASDKAQVSKLRAFVKAGADGVSKGYSIVDVLSRTKDILNNDMKDAKTLSAFDAYVVVCRRQMEEADKGALTDDRIKEIVAKNDPDAKTLKERLEKVMSTITNIHEDATDPELKVAIETAFHAVKAASEIALKYKV